ncbi:MAG: discoidin domain-containing protein, partial [Tannerellaceae bacterium]|nr:discoidin domain-containing protein [Tannerellaceae bacterium]
GMEGTRNGRYWMPAECDVPLRPGWFYHKTEDDLVKTPKQLLELYYKSVGRGACLDLGINLDTEGRFPEKDKETLLAFGRLLESIFTNNLMAGATFTASNIRANNSQRFDPGNLIDSDRYSYWATDNRITTPELIIDLPEPRTFNVIRLRENIKLGQRIEKFAIDTWEEAGWKEIATGTSIGANRLIPLPTRITSGKLRLRILQSPVCIALSDIGLFLEPEEVRTATEPIAIDFEYKKEGWKVISPNSPLNTEKAIDGDESTFWQAASEVLPQELIIDMGTTQFVNGITYLPRQDRKREGIITWYRFYVSTDGNTWQRIAEGEFSNIAANPLKQRIILEHPVRARYLKMEAVEAIPGEGVTIAEIGAF